MEISNFFDFGSKLVLTTFHAPPIGLDDDWRLIMGDYEGIQFPMVFKQTDGKILRDILDTGFPQLFLISDRMKNLLEQNNVTGYKTFPIRLSDKKNNEIIGYHGFSITGRCGPIDYAKSEIIQKSSVEDGPLRSYYKGLYVGFDRWDRSDFFLPEGNLTIVVTKKTADILKKNKITNLVLENLADSEISVNSIKIMRGETPLKQPIWARIEAFKGLVPFHEIDSWLNEKISQKEANEIMSYDSLINADPQSSWVICEGPPEPQDEKPKPKVRLIENLLTGELWELVEPSEHSKGRFICLGKSPFSTPKNTDVNSDKSQ